MKKCLIIGAGQLGSRHLQGLIKFPEKMNIYLVDPSNKALNLAKQRANEIESNHNVFYYFELNRIPDFFDLVIISTNSKNRYMIIKKLLSISTVRYLILEKVLFQKIEHFKAISVLLMKYKVKTFINHPRRMYQSYLNLKKSILPNKQCSFSVAGGNWGLASNTLHFLDLFVYLSGSKLKSINTDLIDEKTIKSKRDGYIEFTGVITGYLYNNSSFSISSFKGYPSAISLTVLNDEQRFFIQEEETSSIYKLEKKNSFSLEKCDFKMEYQSDLTTFLVEEIFFKGYCNLPLLEESINTHKLFTKAMIEKYNKINKSKNENLPIT